MTEATNKFNFLEMSQIPVLEMANKLFISSINLTV